jgi:hypothetical protein
MAYIESRPRARAVWTAAHRQARGGPGAATRQATGERELHRVVAAVAEAERGTVGP